MLSFLLHLAGIKFQSISNTTQVYDRPSVSGAMTGITEDHYQIFMSEDKTKREAATKACISTYARDVISMLSERSVTVQSEQDL